MKQYVRGETPVEEAISLIVQSLPYPKGAETVSLLQGLGCVLAVPVKIRIPQPPFTRSPLDGYALRASDIRGVSKERPVKLSVSQYLPAGSGRVRPLPAGMTDRIMTGAPVPEGADCVVRQEDTDQSDEEVCFYACVDRGSNLCYEGEDIPAGDCLVEAGARIAFARIGVTSGQGMEWVEVYEKPRVAVMSTGDELFASGIPLGPRKIYDSNSMMLTARLMELGTWADIYPAAADDPQVLADRVDQLLSRYSPVITTGGMSVGEKDFMSGTARMVCTRLLFQGIDAEPGSPILGAVRGDGVLLVLSGNLFASLAISELLALPAPARLSGDIRWRAVGVRAKMKGNFKKSSNTRGFIRARIEDGYVSIPEKGHSFGGIGGLSGCNCMIDVPGCNGPFSEGSVVMVWSL